MGGNMNNNKTNVKGKKKLNPTTWDTANKSLYFKPKEIIIKGELRIIIDP